MNKQRFCRWILILLIIFPWAAASAAGPDIWLSGDGSLRTDAVAVSAASGNEYTFFLPGGAFRGGSLCFGIADGISFRIGGTEIHTGDSAAMLKPGGSYEVSVNGYINGVVDTEKNEELREIGNLMNEEIDYQQQHSS